MFQHDSQCRQPRKAHQLKGDGRKHCTSVRERVKIREEVKTGKKTAKDVQMEFSCSARAVRKILSADSERRDAIRASRNMNMDMLKPHIHDPAKLVFEELVVDFIKKNRTSFCCHGIGISVDLVRASAEQAAREMGISFNAYSKTWYENFVAKYNVRCTKLHGEGGSVPSFEHYERDLEQMKKIKLRSYDTDHIFNLDETGLFYECLPKLTFI
jgi:hypothetical protein